VHPGESADTAHLFLGERNGNPRRYVTIAYRAEGRIYRINRLFRLASHINMPSCSRRTILKIGGVALSAQVIDPRLAREYAALSVAHPQRPQARRRKKVVVAGAGIGGLSCGYELMTRGHEVILLEASGRAGGHVKTIRDPFADDLYADVGAEQFTKPGYDLYWGYLREFNLTPLYYPHRKDMIRFFDGKIFTDQDLMNPKVLSGLGFNQKETQYLAHHSWGDLPLLYLKPYLDSFSDEYHPFKEGLDRLDDETFSDLLRRDGASPAAIRFIGGDGSALQVVWQAAILKLRGVPLDPSELYRLKGGNQVLTDAFAIKLGARLHLGAPVTRIERGESAVRVHYRQFGREKRMEADHLVCCMSAIMLRLIPVTPPWPEEKAYALNQIAYDIKSRVVFQSRTAFWRKDHISPNWEGASPDLRELWSMAEEVPTSRAILVATAESSATAQDSLSAFRRLYPGQSEDIEHAVIYSWADDRWSAPCQTLTYRPGILRRMWPSIMAPVGRVHFAGAYTDNMNWGMEAATRSAHRVAEAIDRA
jgi:monoamine oxidase